LGATLLLACTGCGRGTDLYRVTGTVRHQGQPVEGAVVTFICAQPPKTATGTTDRDGRFELRTYPDGRGAVAGKHKVTVTKLAAPAGVSNVSAMDEMVEKAKAPQVPAASSINQLPARYAKPETSQLEFEVTPSGKNDFALELTD
jgi:hypothetical protein